jgi:hypothetical protein
MVRHMRIAGHTPRKFSAKCAYRVITGGVGYNLSQEAPEAFAEAVIEVDGC